MDVIVVIFVALFVALAVSISIIALLKVIDLEEELKRYQQQPNFDIPKVARRIRLPSEKI